MAQHFPDSDLDWKRYFRAYLDNPEHPFDEVVRAMLLEFYSATSAKERCALGGRFGGLLRRKRSEARLALAEGIMCSLGITTTQHVAFEVMRQLFGSSASTDMLDKLFADPSRDASEKHVAAARAALNRAPGMIKRYSGLYEWYCSELKHRVAKVRAVARARP